MRISWMTETSRGHVAPTISWRPRMGRPRVRSIGTRHVWWARVRVRTVWPRAPRGSPVWSVCTASRVSRVQTVISAARAVKGDTDTGLTSDLAVNSSLPRMFIFNQNSNDFLDFLYTLLTVQSNVVSTIRCDECIKRFIIRQTKQDDTIENTYL